MTTKPTPSKPAKQKGKPGRPRKSEEEKAETKRAANKRKHEGKGKYQAIAADIIAEQKAAKALEQRRQAAKQPKDLSNHISPSEAIRRQALANPHPIFGRTPIYRPEYCDRAVEIMNDGLSIVGVAGELGVTKEAIREWAQKYPEFGVAVGIGTAKAVTFWERRLVELAKGIGGGAPGRAVAIIFGLKNRAPDVWRDVQVVEENKTVKVTISATRESLMRKLDRIAETNVVDVPQLEAPSESSLTSQRIFEREIEHEAA